MPPALLNALDYVFAEWAYKPASVVSYGGVSAGTRSAQMTRQMLTGLKVMPLPEAVSIPFFSNMITEGRFKAGELQEKSATAMFDELGRWAVALATLRK
jgi:NAD(P)H-dependent FMN reductase